MIKRSTWVMVILLAAVSGLAYYMKTVPDNFIQKALSAGKTPTPSLDHGTLIPASDLPIIVIHIASADGHSVALTHKDSGWTVSIDDHDSVPADQSAAEQASSQASTLRVTSATIPAATSDLVGFGLDSPQYTYTVTLLSGKTVIFKIGKATITEDGYYVEREDKSVVIVDRYTLDSLINLLKQPPLMFPYTATPTVTITPTGTLTPTPPAATATPTPTLTPTPGAT